MAGSSDNHSADSFSLKLSLIGVASFVFLSAGDFICLALLKHLEHLEVTADSLLKFAEAEGTKTVFATLGLLLSVLLGPTESFLTPDLFDKMGEKHIPFCWFRKSGMRLFFGCKGPVSMRCKWVIDVRFKKQKTSISGIPLYLKIFWNILGFNFHSPASLTH